MKLKHFSLASKFALAPCALLLVTAGCGGGNGSSPFKAQTNPTTTPTTPTTTPTTPTDDPNASGTILIVPEAGSNFGSGTFKLTNLNAEIENNRFVITATDTLNRTLELQLPATFTPGGGPPVQAGQTFDFGQSPDRLLTITSGGNVWGDFLTTGGSIKILSASNTSITLKFQDVTVQPSLFAVQTSRATGRLTLNDTLTVTSN